MARNGARAWPLVDDTHAEALLIEQRQVLLFALLLAALILYPVLVDVLTTPDMPVRYLPPPDPVIVVQGSLAAAG